MKYCFHFLIKKTINEHSYDLDNLGDTNNLDVNIPSPKVSASFFYLI